MSRRLLRRQVFVGDAATRLKDLPEASVDCVVTSPPYFRLRNYGVDGQLGLERHVDDWVQSLREVLSELHRVLTPTGSLWLNLGDTYARNEADGAAAKSLVLAPERVAQLLLEDGWIIRNKVIWAKTNPMPTSVRDRLSCTYEVVYFATRSRGYYFDLDAVRVPHRTATRPSARPAAAPAWSVPPEWRAPLTGSNGGLNRLKASGLPGHPLGKNPGDVWRLSTAGYRGAHHATFPAGLAEVPIKATCPERVCITCGLPWRRETARQLGHLAVTGELRPTCSCTPTWRPGLVLDPFLGSGTTAVVAERLGRDWLGIELNPAFAAQAEARIEAARTLTSADSQEAA